MNPTAVPWLASMTEGEIGATISEQVPRLPWYNSPHKFAVNRAKLPQTRVEEADSSQIPPGPVIMTRHPERLWYGLSQGFLPTLQKWHTRPRTEIELVLDGTGEFVSDVADTLRGIQPGYNGRVRCMLLLE